MPRVKIVIWLLFVVFGSYCHQAPASARQYEVGSTYTYSYTTSVLLNDAPLPGKDVGYQVTSDIELAAVWQGSDGSMLLKLTVNNPKLHIKSRKAPTPEGFVFHASKLDSASLPPALLLWKSGHIEFIYLEKDIDTSLSNLYKGIASLFQYQISNTELEEVDASGKCIVSYKSSGARSFKKTKSSCSAALTAPYFTTPFPVLGTTVDSKRETTFELTRDEPVLQNVKSSETHQFGVVLRPDTGSLVKSEQHLKLKGSNTGSITLKVSSSEGAVKMVSSELGISFKEETLTPQWEHQPCERNCPTLASIVAEQKANLKTSNLASVKSVSAFNKVLNIMKESSQEEISEILKEKANKNVLNQLVDIVAAAQTLTAHKAAMELFETKARNNDRMERYLLGVSMQTHPNEDVIRNLLDLSKSGELKNEQLAESLLLTVAAMTKTFSQIEGNEQKKIVTEVKQFILNGLSKCKDDPCKPKYLRALKNLGRKDTVLVLISEAVKGERKASVAAIKALHSMPDEFIDDNMKKSLMKIFLQLDRKYDSSARTLAVDILVRHKPSLETVEILMSCVVEGRPPQELNTYVLRRLEEVAEKNPCLRRHLQDVLKNPLFGNYNTLAQKGLSTAFSRALTEDATSNGSFTSTMEMGGGLLKRSSFDVFIGNKAGNLQVLSLGLFAGGLSGFAGGDADDAEDDEDTATAGMELTLRGVQLRPFVFFTGQSELMGHVWSGTASDRTPALQGSMLLQDHFEVLPLQNGFQAELDLNSALSLDFSGLIQISLWNRNCHTLVENKVAALLQGITRVDTSFVRSHVEFNVAGETSLDFQTDIDFYDKIVMCLQMSQPNFIVKHNIHKVERIPGSKHKLRKSKYRNEPVQGRSYAFNSKNNELCAQMFGKK